MIWISCTRQVCENLWNIQLIWRSGNEQIIIFWFISIWSTPAKVELSHLQYEHRRDDLYFHHLLQSNIKSAYISDSLHRQQRWHTCLADVRLFGESSDIQVICITISLDAFVWEGRQCYCIGPCRACLAENETCWRHQNEKLSCQRSVVPLQPSLAQWDVAFQQALISVMWTIHFPKKVSEIDSMGPSWSGWVISCYWRSIDRLRL